MRVALCISGQMRTYKECFDLLNKNILQTLSPDIFIHTWEGSGISHKEKKDTEEGIVTFDDLKNLYNPKDIVIENFESSFLEEYKGVKVPEVLKKKEPSNYKGSIPLFYKMYECNKLKKEYEKKHKFKYDVVIKLRPDLMILDKMALNSIDSDKLYFSDYAINQHHQISDKFAYGSSTVMDQYTNVWEHLKEYWENPLGENTWETHRVGERLMFYHINNHLNMDNEAFRLRCYIKRHGDSDNPYSFTNRIKGKFKRIFRSRKK